MPLCGHADERSALRQTVQVHTHHLDIGEHEVRKRFVSWSDGEAEREWEGLTLLDRYARGLAPRPIQRETQYGAPVVVMSRVAGEPLGDAVLTHTQFQGLTEALQRLMGLPLSQQMPERAWGPTVMRARVGEWARPEPDLRQCLEPAIVTVALEAARSWLATATTAFDTVADPVVARGDGNLNNVLWDATTCRLIDFEEFGTSDLAYEVADIVEHASSRLDHLLDVVSFIEAMGLEHEQRLRLTYFRQLFAAFWLVKLLPGNGGFERNPAGSTEAQASHLLALLDVP